MVRAIFGAAMTIALVLGACSPPGAEPVTAALATTPATIHERIFTLDTHLDTPIVFERRGWDFAVRHAWATDLSHVDLPRMAAGGLDGGFFVLYTPQGTIGEGDDAAALATARRRLAAFDQVMAANAAQIGVARTADQGAALARAGKRVAFLAMENSSPLGADLALLDEFHRGGVRMAGPVHNGGNRLADSAGGTVRHGGLSPLGREWVARMNRLGMMIDGSHSSDATLRQMMALSATPVILSHSGFKAIFDHPRNIDDVLAREVAAQGGVIHVNSIFLSRYNSTPARSALSAQMERMSTMTAAEQRAIADAWTELDRTERVNEGDFALYMRAIRHCIATIGVDHCGIGADWDGGAGLADFVDIVDVPRITAALIADGHSEADVAKIWSGNILRVMRAAEAHAAGR